MASKTIYEGEYDDCDIEVNACNGEMTINVGAGWDGASYSLTRTEALALADAIREHFGEEGE